MSWKNWACKLFGHKWEHVGYDVDPPYFSVERCERCDRYRLERV